MQESNQHGSIEQPQTESIQIDLQSCPYDRRKAKFYANYMLALSRNDQDNFRDDGDDFTDFDLDQQMENINVQTRPINNYERPKVLKDS